MRPDYEEALSRVEVLTRLSAYDPHVAGTLPLGLGCEDSDIDILCLAPDAGAFAGCLWSSFSAHEDFRMWQWNYSGGPTIARFSAEGWEIEIFGQNLAVRQQAAWQHLLIEQRLLSLGGSQLRKAVITERSRGAKTEPAFAAVLGLQGNPYHALLELGQQSDDVLLRALRRANFRSGTKKSGSF